MLFKYLATIFLGLATLSEAVVPMREVGFGLRKRDSDSDAKASVTCLNPKAIQTGSENNGQGTPVSGQAASKT